MKSCFQNCRRAVLNKAGNFYVSSFQLLRSHDEKSLLFEVIDAFVIGFAFVKDSALGSFLTSKIPPHYHFLK